MAYVKFFEEKCFVCSLSFRAVKKKELVVCRNYPNFFFFFFFCFCFLLILKKKVFSSFKVIVLREAKVNAFQVDPVSVMYVCLTNFEICHWMGFKKYKKCRLSYFYN